MDMDTDLPTDTEVVICIHIRGICIRVPGRFFVPVLNTKDIAYYCHKCYYV